MNNKNKELEKIKMKKEKNNKEKKILKLKRMNSKLNNIKMNDIIESDAVYEISEEYSLEPVYEIECTNCKMIMEIDEGVEVVICPKCFEEMYIDWE